jgi:hypothetical protein
MGRGLGPRCSAHGSTEPASNVDRAPSDGRARLKREGVRLPAVENKTGGRDLTSPRSNLDRGSLDERQGFNEPKGYLISNPERGSHDGPLGFNEPTI